VLLTHPLSCVSDHKIQKVTDVLLASDGSHFALKRRMVCRRTSTLNDGSSYDYASSLVSTAGANGGSIECHFMGQPEQTSCPTSQQVPCPNASANGYGTGCSSRVTQGARPVTTCLDMELMTDQLVKMQHLEATSYRYGAYLPPDSARKNSKRLNSMWREKICQWTYNVVDQ
jgi:hypothetical protein